MTGRIFPIDRFGEVSRLVSVIPKGFQAWAALIVRISASLLVLMGCVVMSGWAIQSPAIVQINPTFTPMQFNTALCFGLSGAGLWLVALQRWRLATGLGMAIGLIAGLTLIQYLTGLSFGLDELFMTHFTEVETSHPGRMAPNTAVAFVLCGGFLIGASLPGERPLARSSLLIISPVVIGLALLSLAGYASGLEVLFGWSVHTRMAIHTSVGFLIFGIGAACKAWRLESRRGQSRSFSIVSPVVVASLTLLAGLWVALTHYEAQRVAQLAAIDPAIARTALPEIVAGVGLLATVLVGVAVHFVHRAQETHRLREANRDLRAAVQELDKFAHVASHDLKAPLRGIRQLAIWLKKDLAEDADPRTARYLNQMDTRIERLQDLLDALLSYSRIGQSQRRPERFELDTAVREVVSLASPPAGMAVEVDLKGVELKMDRGLFDATLLNLISNAAKHHDRPQGKIRITAEDLGEWVAVRVADDGPGIDPRFHARIFEIFQTLTSRDELEASGIGLAIVRKALKHSGGEIRLESDPEQARGSVFIVTWPKGVKGEHRHNQKSAR